MRARTAQKRLPILSYLLWPVFIVYLLCVFSLLIFKCLPFSINIGLAPVFAPSPRQTSMFNLEVLSSIRLFLDAGRYGMADRHILMNLLGNLLIFTPYGLLLPLILRHRLANLTCFFSGLCCILSIELVQLITGLGIWDIDDILLNTAGLVLGILLAWLPVHALQLHRQ